MKTVCSNCGGNGTVHHVNADAVLVEENCPPCGGTGRIDQ